MKLILGSGSPRRKEILKEAGFSFQVITAEVEESEDASLGLIGLCSLNARRKAEAVYEKCADDSCVVIGSDTVVWLEGKAYGKPECYEDAHRMLTELSGKTHQVGTGVAIVTRKGTELYSETADVTFLPLQEADITSYLRDVPVMDKAGSYAIQDGGERIIEKYDGEFECIMGLPIRKLTQKLMALE